MKAPAMPKMKLPAFKLPAIDFKQIAEEFKTLDPKDPGLWPLIPRVIILLGIFIVLLVGAWWLGWHGQMESLDGKEKEEIKLKDEWKDKKKQAVNLEAYRKQLVEIDRSFGVLLKQLPNRTEMESLLIDINQAGLGRGLQFEQFKPNVEVQKGFYAELPITVKVSGNYHDLGSFAGDVAKMSRIVTLNDIDIVETAKDVKDVTQAKAASGSGQLTMSTIAKTFRYLDDEEMAKLKKEQADKNKAKAAPAGAKK